MTSDDATPIDAPTPDSLDTLDTPKADGGATNPVLTPTTLPPLGKPPLDPRVLRTVLTSYEGETIVVPQCDSPVYHGYGTAIFSTGFTYSGAFHWGRLHGHGGIVWNSGVTYEGDLVDNEMMGRGTYTWPNGSSYVGDIVRGRRHGYGIFCTGTRGVVTLNRESLALDTEGAPHTLNPLQFTYHCADSADALEATSNARYEGQWVDGLPYGRGILVFDDDQHVRYEGDFVEGKRHGHGEMRYASGNIYVGEWAHDVKSGHGTMLWMAAGGSGPIEKYDGAWHDDRPHGHGRHVWLGSSKSPQREKNWYEGDFAHGVRHGRGAFFYANGARYEGEWVENVKHGTGVFFYEDGRVFVGEFRDDRAIDSHTSDTASGSKILLFVDDLLPQEGRDRARKLLEHAVLRLNTELRALYRQYIALPTPGSPTRQSASPVKSTDDPNDTSAVLMEYYECRRLLADGGLKLSAGHLERHLERVRDAQRLAMIPDDAVLPPVRITEAVTLAASLPEVVPPSRLLLFREFAELLVRLAYERLERDFETSGTGPQLLADAFVALYEHLTRERQQRLTGGKTTVLADNWPSVLEQLHVKELHIIYLKHHRAFERFFVACRHRDQPTPTEINDEPEDTTVGPPTVSVRSLLAQLQDLHVFSASFRLRHALLALEDAFSLDDDNDSPTNATTIDPFFVTMPLLFTDFLDAIAIVLLTKHQQLPDEQHQDTPVGTPLFALVDEFLYALPMQL